uniref:Uncharacterized protein n=1 Tax=Arundo donax TaxID=35708 RepID=A0A0A8ZJW9_ARUDO
MYYLFHCFFHDSLRVWRHS